MKIEAYWPGHVKIFGSPKYGMSMMWKIAINDREGEWEIVLMADDEFLQELEQKLVKLRAMRTEENP